MKKDSEHNFMLVLEFLASIIVSVYAGLGHLFIYGISTIELVFGMGISACVAILLISQSMRITALKSMMKRAGKKK